MEYLFIVIFVGRNMGTEYMKKVEQIKFVKDEFARKLSSELDLAWVPSPLFLPVGSGLQDDLAGTQEPVSFSLKSRMERFEIVHSLAKWKRFTLGKYDFPVGRGLYTDMKAIRKEEDLSPIHSHYVDQWDWEKVISKKDRTLDYLKDVVSKIYESILHLESSLSQKYDLLKRLPEKITFIHTEDLEEMLPELSAKEREDYIAKKYGAVFLIGIGGKLGSGKIHDVRAFDYDDWSSETIGGRKGLNGDIIVWDDIRKKSLELSSMGIRVDRAALLRQSVEMDFNDLMKVPFHRGIIEETLPLTIGGGIGQSRLVMFLLQKRHIGEVQAGEWGEVMVKQCEKENILLL
jgi:aspartate--ammonia ligase